MKGYPACLGVVLLLAGCCCVAASPGAKSSADDFAEFREKYPWTVSRELIARGVPGSVPETVIDEALVPTYTLPDLFVSQSGEHITTAAEWELKRRKELLGLFESEVFGHAPPKPERIAFEQVDQEWSSRKTFRPSSHTRSATTCLSFSTVAMEFMEGCFLDWSLV